MISDKESAVLSLGAHCFMKNIPIAIPSYSIYCCMTNHLRVSNRDHFIPSPIQRVRSSERVQQGFCFVLCCFFVSAPQCLGPLPGRLKLGVIQQQSQNHRQSRSLTHREADAACHLGPQWGCWPEHLHTASIYGPYASL